MFKSDNISTLAKALLAAQKEMGSATKDSKNPYFKSNYADLSSVIDASVPVLNKFGIAVLQLPTTIEAHSQIVGTTTKSVLRTVLLHESGEFLGSDTDIVSAKQNDPQAYGSAISYARRYGLQATVTLKASDDDGEGAMNRNTKSMTSDTLSAKAFTTTGTIVVDNTGSSGTLTGVKESTEKKRVSFAKKTPAPTVTTTEDEI